MRDTTDSMFPHLNDLLSAMILSIPLLTEASLTRGLLASVRCPEWPGPHSSCSEKEEEDAKGRDEATLRNSGRGDGPLIVAAGRKIALGRASYCVYHEKRP